MISKRLRTRKAASWRELFEENNVPSGLVYKIADVVNDPQLKQRRFFRMSPGKIPELGSPIRFADFKRQTPRTAPKLGEHTRQILKELGYTNQSIDKLQSSNVL
jgi:crotonobetainyl-CoA:carnitine CoA-transferase CaiB-like acyl-CoA transferase